MNTPFGPVMQLGYIVENIEKTALTWVEQVGAGPFYLLDSVTLDHYQFRGTESKLELALGFGYWNEMQIELIHPLSKEDSLYTHALRDAPGQLNHMATLVTDLEAALDENKLRDKVVQAGGMPDDQRFVYLERYLPGGFHLELLQAPQSTLGFFDMMQTVARHWQGGKPVRSVQSLMDDYNALNL